MELFYVIAGGWLGLSFGLGAAWVFTARWSNRERSHHPKSMGGGHSA